MSIVSQEHDVEERQERQTKRLCKISNEPRG